MYYTTTIHVDHEDWRHFRRICQQERTTASRKLREMMESYISEYLDKPVQTRKNPQEGQADG